MVPSPCDQIILIASAERQVIMYAWIIYPDDAWEIFPIAGASSHNEEEIVLRLPDGGSKTMDTRAFKRLQLVDQGGQLLTTPDASLTWAGKID